MSFQPETYRDAALERITLASHLYEAGDFVFAIYSAGLAVECMFRAYRTAIDPIFDARHVLPELYKQSRFAELAIGSKAAEVGRAVGVVASIWRNEHRFRSEKALRRFLNRHGLYHGIKGDVLKENARRTVNDASVIVNHGATRWNR